MTSRVHRFRLVALASLAVGLGVLSAGCSRETGSQPVPSVVGGPSPVDEAPSLAAGEAPLRIELIGEAVQALQAQLGAPQRFLEVNATPTLVNLFVATAEGAAAVAYVFAGGVLSAPAPPEDVKPGAPTFGASDIAFDVERVIARLVVALPLSQYRVFSIVGKAGGGVSYLINILSSEGGEMQIPVTGDGVIIGVLQN